jgi:2-oxo-4-hydroxy-4-carboxy-5-ureidoimidazoline decarboxylase
LEAFKIHPRIGDIESLRKKFASTASWASDEQSGASEAAEDVLHELSEGNDHYEKKFGYIFIVCATGKSATEMLTLLKNRLHNNPEAEFAIACEEQKKITNLRLDKLLQ